MLIYTTSILRNCSRYFLRKSETEFTISESLMSHHMCHHECQVINMDAEMDENGSSLENKTDEINCKPSRKYEHGSSSINFQLNFPLQEIITNWTQRNIFG